MQAKTCMWMALVFLLLTVCQFAIAQPLDASAEVGSGTASEPSVAVLGNLPQLTPQVRGQPTRLPRPQTGLTDAEWKALKEQAAKGPDLTEHAGQAPFMPPVRLQNGTLEEGEVFTPGASVGFLAQDQTLFCSGVTPSDMALAVGANFVVQVVNDCIAVYDKAGTIQAGYPKSLNSFLGLSANNFGVGRFVTDPRATYDFVQNRFVVLALFEDLPNSRGFLGLAASQTSDPRGAWNIYQLQIGGNGNCPDYPTLGQSWALDPFNGAIFVGINIFSCNPNGFGAFAGDQVLFLPKTPIYNGRGFGFNFGFNFTVGGALVDTIQPVNVAQPGDKPRAEFAVNSFNLNFGGGQCRSGCNGLVIWAFANTLQQSGSPGPVISAVVIGTPSNYSLSGDADEPGATNVIETIDTRITGTVQYRGGFLYPTLDTGNGGTSAILGWQVQPFLNDNAGGCTGAFTNACPMITGASIVKEFCYFCGAGHAGGAYFGTIQPDPEGNWTMVFNFSSGAIFPGTAYTSNRVTWQQPFHDSGIFLITGQGFYGQGRWGDYTATAPDLLAGNGTPQTVPAFWFSGMFSRSDGAWGTAIGKNAFVSVTDP
jgi:hypothetical protein